MDKDVLLSLVVIANSQAAAHAGKTVHESTAGAEVAYVLWHDVREPHGFGCLVVKGEETLREITACGIAREVATSAFVVPDRFHAEAVALALR